VARPEEVILDASVIVKWFTDEEGSDKARRIRDRHVAGLVTITSADLALYEVVNALRYNPGFDADDVGRACRDLMGLEMDLVTPTEELLERAAKNAYDYDISAYDAYYLGLAELLGSKILTADKEFYRKAKRSRLIDFLGETED
jgi:predicted nucleic acid-binding protein